MKSTLSARRTNWAKRERGKQINGKRDQKEGIKDKRIRKEPSQPSLPRLSLYRFPLFSSSLLPRFPLFYSGEIRRSHQVAVAFSGSATPFVNRPNDKTLPTATIASREDSGHARGKLAVLSFGV